MKQSEAALKAPLAKDPLGAAPRRRSRPRVGAQKATQAENQPLAIIADDDETMRLLLQRALTFAGWLAIPVDDGGEIWPILERENVAALVLDLNMPGVNGWEVLRTLRSDVRFRSRPVRVIIVSGQSDRESREFAFRLGADCFLTKPLDLEELRKAVTART